MSEKVIKIRSLLLHGDKARSKIQKYVVEFLCKGDLRNLNDYVRTVKNVNVIR